VSASSPSTYRPASVPLIPRADGVFALGLDFYGERLTLRTEHPELVNQVLTDLGAFVVGEEPLEGAPSLTLQCAPSDPISPCYLAFWRALGDTLAHRFLLLHAGAVCSPERAHPRDSDGSSREATLFIGPGGSGKTTMVLAATRLGWQPMGDDVVALEWETARLYSVSAPYRVRPDTKRSALATDALIGASRDVWECPAPTRPALAPRLARVVLLGADACALAPDQSAASVLMANLRIGSTLAPALLLQRLLHGLRFAELVRAPNRPPMEPTLAPQLAFVRSLLHHVGEAPHDS